MELEPEPPPESPREEPPEEKPRPRPVLAEKPPPARTSSPRLEERPPAPVPVPSRDFDSTPAYVPGGYETTSDPYKYTAAKSRPSWHWIALAAVCGIGLARYSQKAPPATQPPAQKAPEAEKPVTPAAAAVINPISDAKDAAAMQAAAQLTAAAGLGQPVPPAPPKRRPAPKPARPAPDAEPAPQAADSPSPFDDGGSKPRGSSSEWRMRGTIFDLITAEPVGRAEVIFTDPRNGRPFRTGTDMKGNYRATLPVTENGYDLTIRHEKYEPKYFEDGVPSYRKLGMEERQKHADGFMKVLQNKDLVRAESGEVLQRDFVLIPLER